MKSIKEILKENNFRFNKQFGQNFILDETLLDNMAMDANISKDDTVLEIGPGAGTLTRSLSKVAKNVISFEIDRNLKEVLAQTLVGYDNVEVIFQDIQRLKEEDIIKIVGEDYKVVANLPYYITTPLIMKFLEFEHKPKSITVMIQKEVAERIVSKAGDSEFGAITLAINLEGDASILRIVTKENFMPVPKVDSAIIRIDINDKYKDVDKKSVKKLIRAAFAMRRKTLVNCILNIYPIQRAELEEILTELGINTKIRGEELSIDQYIELAKRI